jgi:NADPH:quinone reductase-like Zn-dependent oxidoreductase
MPAATMTFVVDPSQKGRPMKAVGYLQSLPIDHPESLVDLELPAPAPGPLDLLVRVAAVSANPVDTKVRRNRAPTASRPEVLGWDAVGTVEALGEGTTRFSVGDRVYGRMPLAKIGAFAEYATVAENALAKVPDYLSDEEAACVPLTVLKMR